MLGLQECLIPRLEKNQSIKLSQPGQSPFHQNKCECDMCNEYEAKVIEKMMIGKSNEIVGKLKKRQNLNRLHSGPMEYILKKLITPHHKIITRNINILIPEICIYKDGEAHSLYMNVDQSDRGHKSQFLKEKKEQMIIRIKKEKLTNTQLQKIFSEKRRKYRQKVGTAFKRKLSKKMSFFQKKQQLPQTKDAIVITYLDGYEELQTENEFINLMLKRKQDPIFRRIDFIKNFIGVTEEDKRIIFVKYEQDNCKYQNLMERSKALMKVFGANIIIGDEKYISPEDEFKFTQALQKSSDEALAHYTLYKIINYIQYFYDEKITNITVKFLLNQCSELYLLHVYSVMKVDLVKYNWTHETYTKKVAEEENRLFQRQTRPIDSGERSMERSRKIEEQMKYHYQQLKNVMGFGHVEKNDEQEKANNSFFALIHPEVTIPISEILKDKGMTITKFQQNILGYKNKKKSVAQAFNSNLVKTLHKMTPALHVTRGHVIDNVQFPKTPTLTSRSKRSFSMGNTLSTVNKTMTLFL